MQCVVVQESIFGDLTFFGICDLTYVELIGFSFIFRFFFLFLSFFWSWRGRCSSGFKIDVCRALLMLEPRSRSQCAMRVEGYRMSRLPFCLPDSGVDQKAQFVA